MLFCFPLVAISCGSASLSSVLSILSLLSPLSSLSSTTPERQHPVALHQRAPASDHRWHRPRLTTACILNSNAFAAYYFDHFYKGIVRGAWSVKFPTGCRRDVVAVSSHAFLASHEIDCHFVSPTVVPTLDVLRPPSYDWDVWEIAARQRHADTESMHGKEGGETASSSGLKATSPASRRTATAHGNRRRVGARQRRTVIAVEQDARQRRTETEQQSFFLLTLS